MFLARSLVEELHNPTILCSRASHPTAAVYTIPLSWISLLIMSVNFVMFPHSWCWWRWHGEIHWTSIKGNELRELVGFIEFKLVEFHILPLQRHSNTKSPWLLQKHSSIKRSQASRDSIISGYFSGFHCQSLKISNQAGNYKTEVCAQFVHVGFK